MFEILKKIKKWVRNEPARPIGRYGKYDRVITVSKYFMAQKKINYPTIYFSLGASIIEKMGWNDKTRLCLHLGEENPLIMKLERCPEGFKPKGSRVLRNSGKRHQISFTWSFGPKYPFKLTAEDKKGYDCPYEISEGSLIIMTE